MNSATAAAVGTVGVVGFVTVLAAWLVYVVGNVQKERIRRRADNQRALFDKIENEAGLRDFLESASGKRFFESIERADALAGILASLRHGVVLIALGLGLGLAGEFYPRWEMAAALGILALFTGAGLLVAGVVSTRMARRLGFLKTE